MSWGDKVIEFYGIDCKGKFKTERLSSLPTWTSDDIGREVFDLSTGNKYVGGNNSWEILVSDRNNYTVDTISDLLALDTTINYKSVNVLGYHSVGDGGGGIFYWNSTGDKSDHNGGTIIDPDIIFPTDWNNTSQQETWFTASTGIGRWERIYDSAVNVKWFGAKGDSAIVLSNLIGCEVLSLDNTSVNLSSEVNFQPNKISIIGNVNNSTINNTLGGFLKFGAVGSSNREITNIDGITFIGNDKIIDANDVFPINIKNSRFFMLGLNAINYYQIYYGKMLDNIFFGTQLLFTEVNNYTIDGTDFHGDSDLLKFTINDYGIVLKQCNKITFSNLSFENWKNTIIKIADYSNIITFNNIWIENNTGNKLFSSENCSIINIHDSYIDLDPSPTDSCFFIDNSNTWTSIINISNTKIKLNSSHTENFLFIDTNENSNVVLTLNNVIITTGHLLVNKNTLINVKNCILSNNQNISPITIESLPNAELLPEYNSWIENSDNKTEWDFLSGTGFTGDLSFSETSIVNEYMTGTKSIKTTIPNDSTEYVVTKSMSNMGPITTEGETHIIFIRLKTSDSLQIQFVIEGFYIEFNTSPIINSKNNIWTDYIIKTSPDTTWSQGTQGSPKLKLKITNGSNDNIDLFIDRIDYKIINNDYFIK